MIFIQIRIVSVLIGMTFLTLIPAIVSAQEVSQVGGVLTVTPGLAGTIGSVPSADTSTVPGPLSATSGIVPSIHAPAPTFGSEPLAQTGLNAPRNGSIRSQIGPSDLPSGNIDVSGQKQ